MAESAAKLASGTTVTADLGVNETTGVAILSPGATMTAGTTLYAERVKLAAGSSVFDVRTNVISGATSGIAGTVETVALPLVAPFCQLDPPQSPCGTGDVEVSGNITELWLDADNYGRVSVGEGAVLYLDDDAPYGFCELRIANRGKVLVKHQVTIDVTGNLIVGTESELRTGGYAPLRLRVGGSKLLLGRDAVVTAAITAPNAKAKVKQASELKGCLCARIIKAAQDATLECGGDVSSPSPAFVD